jgi:hypothetical protein
MGLMTIGCGPRANASVTGWHARVEVVEGNEMRMDEQTKPTTSPASSTAGLEPLQYSTLPFTHSTPNAIVDLVVCIAAIS